MMMFLAESMVGETLVDHTYDAETFEEAEALAESMGWNFLGIPVELDYDSVSVH